MNQIPLKAPPRKYDCRYLSTYIVRSYLSKILPHSDGRAPVLDLIVTTGNAVGFEMLVVHPGNNSSPEVDDTVERVSDGQILVTMRLRVQNSHQSYDNTNATVGARTDCGDTFE